MSNPAFHLEATALRSPDATAVIFRNRHYSYADIFRWSSRLASGLVARGYGKGSRIALSCNNRPAFLIAYYGVLMTGAAVVNLLWSSPEDDFAYLLEDAGCDAFLCFDRYGDRDVASLAIAAAARVPSCREVVILPEDPEAASPIPGVPALSDLMRGQPDLFTIRHFARHDPALVTYTSGSTSRQKGIEISAGAVAEAVNLTIPLFSIEHTAVRLSIFTMECIMTQLFLVLQPTFLGQTVVYLECENAETLIDEATGAQVWENILAHGVTFIVSVPSFYRWLLDHMGTLTPNQIPLKLCISGGAALPATWEREFRDRLGVSLANGYGASETCAALAWSWPHDGNREGFVGKMIPGIEARIVDEDGRDLPLTSQGHLLVRSPAMMTRYLNRPDLTEKALQDGWYCTRDIATFDADGYLKIVGRMDSRISRGNEHILPEEVESLLHRHPAVSLAAVVEVPHPFHGHDGKAFVTLKSGLEPEQRIEAAMLLQWLKKQLPDGQSPGELEIRESLPMTNTGKIARHVLTQSVQ